MQQTIKRSNKIYHTKRPIIAHSCKSLCAVNQKHQSLLLPHTNTKEAFLYPSVGQHTWTPRRLPSVRLVHDVLTRKQISLLYLATIFYGTKLRLTKSRDVGKSQELLHKKNTPEKNSKLFHHLFKMC